jgi:YjbE family integral membrane protein
MPPGNFLLRALSIILIDLMLAGDNALVIALSVRCLNRRDRLVGTAFGAGAAVLLRVALTFIAARLLDLPWLRLAGGVLILWIAIKVFLDASDTPEDSKSAPRRLAQAIWTIVMADLTMSTDNILAIAGASGGSLALIVFGLAVSIPFVVFSANLLAALMDRYPAIVYLGAAILGKVGGEMIMTDPVVVRSIHPSAALRYTVEALLAVALVAGGWLIAAARRRKTA